MRLALIADVALRKKGSIEEWIVATCAEARNRGHSVEVYVEDPVHPEVRARLAEVDVEPRYIDDLMSFPLSSALHLSLHFDLIHINLFGPRDPESLLAYTAITTPVIFADHQSGPPAGDDGRKPNSSSLRDRISGFLDRMTGLRWNGLVGVSEYVTQRDKDRFGLPESKCRTIYNGVDVERFNPRGRPDATEPPLDVLAVAHLIPEKGIRHLIRAMARLEDVPIELTVVGDGPEEEELKDLAGELGLRDRVDFLGLRNDVDDLMHEADVFVHPATWKEAFGYTVMEAMASGCPVIGSEVGGIPELIVDGQTGLLCPPGDDRALARQIRRLAENSDLRAELGKAARKRAERGFTLEECIESTIESCEAILEGEPLTN